MLPPNFKTDKSVQIQEDKPKLYYVLVDGKKLGPYDKRTITGMRVKKVLLNESQIHDEEGNFSTVIELLGHPPPPGPSTGGMESTGAFHPRFMVQLLKPSTRPYAGLSLRGEGEVHLLPDVLRISGTVKSHMLSKGENTRVRIPHWHLEQLDRTGAEILLFAPQYNAMDYHGSLRLKFGTVSEAEDFEAQLRTVMPWLF